MRAARAETREGRLERRELGFLGLPVATGDWRDETRVRVSGFACLPCPPETREESRKERETQRQRVPVVTAARMARWPGEVKRTIVDND